MTAVPRSLFAAGVMKGRSIKVTIIVPDRRHPGDPCAMRQHSIRAVSRAAIEESIQDARAWAEKTIDIAPPARIES